MRYYRGYYRPYFNILDLLLAGWIIGCFYAFYKLLQYIWRKTGRYNWIVMFAIVVGIFYLFSLVPAPSHEFINNINK